MPELRDLETPCLLWDIGRMKANIARMKARLASRDISLRLHCKTCKSVDAALLCQGKSSAPIAVSTLAEAEHFAEAGFDDILYAVGIAPAKLGRAMRLREAGCGLKIICDNMDTAAAIAGFEKGYAFDILLEIDCDGLRGGIQPKSPLLPAIAARLRENGQNILGVMTHAGAAYDMPGPDAGAIARMAANECAKAAQAAQILRAHGHACPIVSVGSTPTALFGERFDGVTEARAGVFLFQDAIQAAIGVCAPNDIAISVLATVIGRTSGKLIIDAGWTALGNEKTANPDYGYGIVANAEGSILPQLHVSALNQEHGVIESSESLPDLPPGTLLRIFPTHACAAANAFTESHIMENGAITAIWAKCRGWRQDFAGKFMENALARP